MIMLCLFNALIYTQYVYQLEMNVKPLFLQLFLIQILKKEQDQYIIIILNREVYASLECFIRKCSRSGSLVFFDFRLGIHSTSLATGRKPIRGRACKGFGYPVERV